MSRPVIAIVGGGIGGVAAGAALLQSGCTVRIFERAGQLREAGTGIILWPNATGILERMGALPEVLRLGQRGTRFLVRSSSGKLFMNICTAAADTPTVGVSRPDLLRALAALVPAEDVYTDHELTTVESTGTSVRLHFRNGESFACDGVVGADGIHSGIRAGIQRARRPVYRGYAILRGLADAPAALASGDNGESWGAGHRFGVLGVGKGKICWYATVNTEDPRDLTEDRKRRLEETFRGWHHPIPELIASTDPEAILLHGAYDVGILPSWSRGPITLLGDAAHAITPNLGQGACLAIEDAFVLAQCLRDGKGVSDSFRRYERLRFHHVRNTILRSRWIGHAGQWQGRAAVTVRNAVTRLLPPRMFECHTSLEERLAALCGTS